LTVRLLELIQCSSGAACCVAALPPAEPEPEPPHAATPSASNRADAATIKRLDMTVPSTDEAGGERKLNRDQGDSRDTA